MTITTEMNEAIHGALKKTEATEGRKVEEEIVTSILSNQVSESPVHTHHNVAYEHVRTFGCVTGQDLKGIEELRNITVSGIRLYGSINKCITLWNKKTEAMSVKESSDTVGWGQDTRNKVNDV